MLGVSGSFEDLVRRAAEPYDGRRRDAVGHLGGRAVDQRPCSVNKLCIRSRRSSHAKTDKAAVQRLATGAVRGNKADLPRNRRVRPYEDR